MKKDKAFILFRYPKTTIFLIILITLITKITYNIIKYSNFDGYCAEEGRYLSEKELIDRYVGLLYPSEEKEIAKRAAMMEERMKQRGERFDYYKSKQHFFQENPGCCEVEKRTLPWEKPTYIEPYIELDIFSPFDEKTVFFIWKLTGKYYFNINSYYKRLDPQGRANYGRKDQGINSCGTKILSDRVGSNTSKENYKSSTKRIREQYNLKPPKYYYYP